MPKKIYFKTKKNNFIILKNKTHLIFNTIFIKKFLNLFIKHGFTFEKQIYLILKNLQLKYNLKIPLLIVLIFEKLKPLFYFQVRKSYSLNYNIPYNLKPYFSFIIILKLFKNLKQIKYNKKKYLLLENELSFLIENKLDKSLIYKQYKKLKDIIINEKMNIHFRW